MTPFAQLVLKYCAQDIDLYGLSVITAFGEYYGHRARLLKHCPRLAQRPVTLSHMIQLLMQG